MDVLVFLRNALFIAGGIALVIIVIQKLAGRS